MPLCYCYTNLPDVPVGFEERFARCLEKVLPNKPIERISVIVVPGTRICKAGSTAPAMIVQIRAIAVFDAEKNKRYFPEFFKFLTTELQLEENWFNIEFIDMQATDVQNGK